MAKALGVTHMAMPTNGNAGAALAAYASRAGIKTTIFCPDDTPEVNVREIALQGAAVYRVNGLIDDCGKIVGEGKAKVGWFDVSTLKEPYRIEGKKTMGLELAEQLGWDVPDVIFYPTGGGTGLIGMWKAFAELEAIGLIGAKRPRMVAVQAAGCAPMVRAFEEGEEHAPRWENAHTIAAGIRVPQAVGDFLILRAVRESGGFAIAVDDEAIAAALDEVARDGGLPAVPGGRARPMPPTSRRSPTAGSRQRRARRAVQLRDRPQISAAAGHPAARPPRADRLRRAMTPYGFAEQAERRHDSAERGDGGQEQAQESRSTADATSAPSAQTAAAERTATLANPSNTRRPGHLEEAGRRLAHHYRDLFRSWQVVHMFQAAHHGQRAAW